MISVLAICDHAKYSASLRGFDEVLPINQIGPSRNLRLEILNVSHWLLDTLKPVTRDLLDLAAYVYYVDTSVRRGTQHDVFEEDWVRSFTVVVPVRRPELWQRKKVVSLLTEMLEYLTEDKFEFIFTKRKDAPEQLVFDSISKQLPPCPEADCVSLFSGGMDSLAGAVYLQALGRKPVLVSHRPRPVLAHIQLKLAEPLRKRFSSWNFPHLGVWINRKHTRAVEETQRSRSFLYAALGALVAHQLGLNELVVCENGITSFNLPRLGQTTGAVATRSTHPRFMQLFKQLVEEVFETDFRLEAPFTWKTRAEVLELLKDNDCADLLPLSSSCAHSHRPKMHPHCGICSQCIDRRLAVTYSGLDTPDELHGYEKDIFIDALDNGTERMHVMSPVQFALDVRQRSLDSFCQRYVQVYDAILDRTSEEGEQILKAIFDLHSRYANEVYDVIGRAHARYWDKVYRHELPDSSLLMLTGPGSSPQVDESTIHRAKQLTEDLRECQVSESKPLEDVCEEILTFLFCEYVPSTHGLKKPEPQSKTDHGYKRRDLLFENRATEGFWKEVRREYEASGVVADAKNYKHTINGNTVNDFSKYLKNYGVGRFGIILARKVPSETRTVSSGKSRTPSAIEEQKTQWKDHQKMIILLGENDIVEMLGMKASGNDPTDLLRDRIFTLKSRM